MPGQLELQTVDMPLSDDGFIAPVTACAQSDQMHDGSWNGIGTNLCDYVNSHSKES